MHYVVLEELGSGAFGSVAKVRRKSDGQVSLRIERETINSKQPLDGVLGPITDNS